MNRMPGRFSGLTLVELIVVLNIFAMLIALSVPVYRSMQRRGRENACKANLTTVWQALEQFKSDNRRYPFHLAELYPTYVDSEKLLICPADPRRGHETITTASETAGLNLLYVRRDVAETGEQIVCGCPFHSHGLVQFLDGRVTTGDFQDAMLKSASNASLLRREELTPVPVHGETPLRTGDAILTGAGGSAIIAFAEGTTLTLGQNTEIVLKIALVADQPSKLIRVLGMFVNALGGPPASVFADVAEGVYDGGGGRFEIQTPTAVAAVRGTKFTVTLQQAVVGNKVVRHTTVCPVYGQVEVRGNGKKKKIKPGDDCVDVTVTSHKSHRGKGKGKGHHGGDDDDDG